MQKAKLENLRNLDYKTAKKIIDKLDKKEKQELCDELTKDYTYTISSLKKYYDALFGSPINKQEYFRIMSIVKKLETLIGYCY